MRVVEETLWTTQAEACADLYVFQCGSGATDSDTIQFKFEGLTMPAIVEVATSYQKQHSDK